MLAMHVPNSSIYTLRHFPSASHRFLLFYIGFKTKDFCVPALAVALTSGS